MSDNQAYQQFGNSVAVNVIERIAQEMLQHIQPINEADTLPTHKEKNKDFANPNLKAIAS